MDLRTLGVILVVAGVLAVIAGVLAMTGSLGWFGRLPGDVRIGNGGTHVYFPLVSLLLVSIVMSLLLAVARRLF